MHVPEVTQNEHDDAEYNPIVDKNKRGVAFEVERIRRCQGANLSRDLRPSWVFRLGQLPPIPFEALPMPTDDGSGLND